jgi:Cft2 family RNA processing exonuclease
VRIFLVYILTFDGFFGAKFDILTPRWLPTPATPPRVDVVVMETTYGDRLHRQLQPSIDELYDAITDGFRRGGNVIVPTFALERALERAQELLYFLHEGIESRRLNPSINVFLDSPMAISVTEIFERHPECYGRDTAKPVSSRTRSLPFARPEIRSGNRRLDGAEQDKGRRRHHGRIGYVHGRPGPSSSQA